MEEGAMTAAKGSGTRAACGALVTTIGLALGAPVCGADDAASREPIEPSLFDDAVGVATDDGGQRLWARQPGTRGFDAARSVATDADGNVYIAGLTEGALGGPNKGDVDAFVIKYDGGGHRLWALQVGTSRYDLAYGIATDADGNVYVVGVTLGALTGPNKEGAFVIKYNGDGHQLWARQPATNEGSIAWDVSADANGNVYIAGSTIEGLGGPYKGSEDAFVIKYDLDGDVLWLRQFGRNVNVGGDFPQGVATDVDGNVCVAGLTYGTLAGADKGSGDAFVIKFAGGSGAVQAVPGS
jgi:Beta-propeller repeat